jgi:hypothetical protein
MFARANGTREALGEAADLGCFYRQKAPTMSAQSSERSTSEAPDSNQRRRTERGVA